MRHVMAAIAEYERAQISIRTKMAKRQQIREGLYIGGQTRVGMKQVDGKVVVDEHEQTCIARAQELRASGLSFQQVSDTMAAEGLRNRAGNAFSKSSIQRLLDATPQLVTA